MTTIGWSAQINLKGQEALRLIAKESRDAAETELRRAKEITTAVNRALLQVRNGMILNEIEKERAQQKLLSEVLPIFAEKLTGSRSRQFVSTVDTRSIRFIVAATAVSMAFFLAGYGLRAWGDFEAFTLSKQCYAHQISSQGHLYCDLGAAQNSTH
jgi:hypothetical protein